MLPRDLETNVFLHKYYPKTDLWIFARDVFLNDKDKLYLVLLNKKEKDENYDTNSKIWYSGVTVAAASFLAGIVFFNKLPLFSRIQSKWGRFFARIILFPGATCVHWGYSAVKRTDLQEAMYQKYFNQYVKYKHTGNLLDLNPNITRKLLLYFIIIDFFSSCLIWFKL